MVHGSYRFRASIPRIRSVLSILRTCLNRDTLAEATESHLLQPPRADRADTTDIQLQKALRTLNTNLKRYEQVMGTMEAGESRAGDAFGYLGFIGRAWAGIFRSRGW